MKLRKLPSLSCRCLLLDKHLKTMTYLCEGELTRIDLINVLWQFWSIIMVQNYIILTHINILWLLPLQITDWLHEIKEIAKPIMQMFTLGQTYENNDIYLMKVCSLQKRCAFHFSICFYTLLLVNFVMKWKDSILFSRLANHQITLNQPSG